MKGSTTVREVSSRVKDTQNRPRMPGANGISREHSCCSSRRQLPEPPTGRAAGRNPVEGKEKSWKNQPITPPGTEICQEDRRGGLATNLDRNPDERNFWLTISSRNESGIRAISYDSKKFRNLVTEISQISPTFTFCDLDDEEQSTANGWSYVFAEKN